ncbi:lipase family protein [Leptolyngbya ohadii]|uniref:lipase family protein n=1 Tax=Leptolyngbya ohadii TaxID=1962290 RepID=UPI000B5A0E19|nr:lipase [Leptolyngbya ohadii]
MNNLNRRKFLFVSVTAGIASSGITRSVQAQPSPSTSDEIIADEIIATDETLDALLGSEHLTPDRSPDRPSNNLSSLSAPPPIHYDRAISRLLIRCSRLGMEQFDQGQRDRRYDGSIRILESFPRELEPYNQVATFRVELDATTTLLPDLGEIGRRLTRRAIPTTLAFIGFVLTSETHNIILFRGTSNPKEWMANFQSGQSNYGRLRGGQGRVHTGFLRLYNRLSRQVRQAASTLNPSLPCFIAGHSLGGALATLAAADLAYHYPTLKDQIRLYTYGAPRVGNQAFVEYLETIAPNSYRVLNMSDMVTMVPPANLREQQYSHFGEAWAFLDYAQGSVSLSHSTSIYQTAIDSRIETNTIPNFPTSC